MAKVKNKDKSNNIKFFIIAIFVAAVIAVLAVLGVGYYHDANNTETMSPGNVALVVGDTEISVGEYNYYYTLISNDFINSADEYGIDTTKDYSSQTTTDDNGKKLTWEQVFENQTKSQIKTVIAFYEAGVKNGFEVSSSQWNEINEYLDNIESAALKSSDSYNSTDMSDSEKMSVINSYLSDTFGKYCGYETVKKILVQTYIARDYMNKYNVETRATIADVKSYYNEHIDDFNSATIAYLPIKYDGKTVTKSDAEKTAQSCVAKIKNRDDLLALVPTACKSLLEARVADSTYSSFADAVEGFKSVLVASVTKNESSFPTAANEWLFRSSTKNNAVKVFTDEQNSIVYVILRENIDNPNVPTYSYRDILVKPSENKQSYWTEAQEKAQNLLSAYNNSEQSEYAFALLAEKNSDDSASISSGTNGIFGGLYSGIYSNSDVDKSILKWVSSKHSRGDVEIVKGADGYHILYYIEGTTDGLYQSEQHVITQNRQKLIDSLKVTNKTGFSNTVKATPKK